MEEAEVAALLSLVLARVRRRPGRWLLTATGLALATAFAGAVAAESTIAGDQAARASLAGLSPLERTVRITWQGPLTPTVQLRAGTLMRTLGLGPPTEVVLLSPVRLDGVLVRPAAIDPLWPWLTSGAPLGACRPARCPMLLAGTPVGRTTLNAAGVRITVVGTTSLRSAAPLGFVPSQPPQRPVLLTGDASGLASIGGLSGVYRTYNWLAPLSLAHLHSWQLPSFERRLQLAQAALLSSGSGFSLTAPFAQIDAARAQAAAAPRRLLLAGGGALAALALFVVLAAGGLRRDVEDQMARLAGAGATSAQGTAFVLLESALLCGAALCAGAVLAIALTPLLASAGGTPVGATLTHSVLSARAALILAGGWAAASALIAALLLVRGQRVVELPAVAATAGLALALGTGTSTHTDGALTLLLAPLCCLAAGVIVARLATFLLRGAERAARRGPVMTRLALVGLARSPGAPALAIAFIAVTVGLAGFALAYRATLSRGAADQAANQVPLDVTVAPGPSFTRPLQVASIARWARLADGSVAPVRRTDASFVDRGSSVTVPALGVPAAVIPRLHGWRSGDGSVAALAHRLEADQPAPASPLTLPPGTAALTIHAASPGLGVSVTADFLDSQDNLQQVKLGQAGRRLATLSARLPPALRDPGIGGRWRLAGLELDEPTGLEATDGHQNAENPGAATQFVAPVRVSGLAELDASGHVVRRIPMTDWRALGAASGAPRRTFAFTASGQPGLLRPREAVDMHPLPVVVDPASAAAAGFDHRIALNIDGLSVAAMVVGTLRRFPTVPVGSSGFVVADQRSLAEVLDAALPGQGRADQLWISTPRPQLLAHALSQAPFSVLAASFRERLARSIRDAPITRAVLRTLLAAAILAAALALVGVLVALAGSARDVRLERDLVAMGIGPQGLSAELRLRVVLAAALGVLAGVVIGIVLTRLAVATVRAAGAVAFPNPPLVAITPWWGLVACGVGGLAVLAGAGVLAAGRVTAREPA